MADSQTLTQKDTSAPDKAQLLKGILAFYIPLSLASMIMMASHNIVNSALSRAINPEAALAAYAVASSVTNMFASPTWTGRQILVARGYDRISYKNCLNVMLKIMVVTLAVIGMLAFTPLGRVVYVDLFGAPSHLIDEIQDVAKLCLLLPLIYTLRASSQGVIMVQKKTRYMTLAMIIRIIVMASLAIIIPTYGWFDGAMIGAAVWIFGMTTESIVNFVAARKLYRNMPQAPTQKNKPVSKRAAFNFLWPLLVTSIIWTFGRPVLNAGLARASNPELALATYQVAFSYAWMLMAFLENNIRQVILLFGDSKAHSEYLRKFTLIVSVILTVGILLITVTPIGTFMLKKFIGVSDDMIRNSRIPMLIIALLPLVVSRTEFYIGLLLKDGNTKAMSVAKIGNLLAMALVIFALVILFPSLGATAGALALSVGLITEVVILKLAQARQHRKPA